MWGDERGQSSTVGAALVLAISVTAATVTVGLAVVTLQETRQLSRTESAVNAMAEFDSSASLVALGEISQRDRVEFGTGQGGQVYVRDGGRMVIQTVENGTVQEVVTNVSLGSVVYRVGDTRVAFEGGGVWKKQPRQQTRMVSQPEFHFRERTLTIPILVVNASGPDAALSETVVVRQDQTYTVFPNASQNYSNPVDSPRIRVKVTSDYYRGWATFFRQRIGGVVTTYDANNTVTVELVSPIDTTMDFGLAATAVAGLEIKGTGSSDAFVDSYDSSEGTYSTSESNNSTIVATGDIVLRGGATVEGDAKVPKGYEVDVQGNSEVTGEILHGNVAVERQHGRVYQAIQDARRDNDNAGDATIQDGDLVRSSDMTLTAGTYYLDGNVVLDSEDLKLDTSGGNITLAINGDLSVKEKGKIQVNGSEAAHVYINGDRFYMYNGKITTPGMRAEQMWVYGRPHLRGKLRSSSVFMGVYYAPSDGDSSLVVRSESHMYGAAVAGTAELRSGAALHYDQALKDDTPYLRQATLVTYFHVSHNEIRVTDD